MAAVLSLAFELLLSRSAVCLKVCVLQQHLSALEQLLCDLLTWYAPQGLRLALWKCCLAAAVC